MKLEIFLFMRIHEDTGLQKRALPIVTPREAKDRKDMELKDEFKG